MGYSVLPFLLLIGSLTIGLVIVVRNFPQLTLLDVDSLPEVKEEKRKDQVFKKRAEAKATRHKHAWRARFKPVALGAQAVFKHARKRIAAIEAKAVQATHMVRIPTLAPEKKRDELRRLLNEAIAARDEGNLELAEQKYIAAIRIHQTCEEAYQGLGDVYMQLEQWAEAKETYGFLLHLKPDDDMAITKMAMIAEEEGDWEKAVALYQQALEINPRITTRLVRFADVLVKVQNYALALEVMHEAVRLEPQNPKYLDRLIEVCIMADNRLLGEEALEQLRLVNPDNQKLALFRERLDKMGNNATPS